MNKSFTLIEILVVIVVIGVLSAFILVGMSSITNSANIAKGQAFANSLRNSLLINLLAEWKLNEGTGVSTADSWGNKTGTLNGPPTWKSGTDCVNGSCLYFDGTVSKYVTTAFVFGAPNYITSEFWIKANTDGNYHWILDGAQSLANGTYGIVRNINDIQYRYSNGTISNAGANYGNFFEGFDNKWMHIVVVADYVGNTVKYYRNGIFLSPAVSMTTPVKPTTTFTNIGNYAAGQYPVIGYIDEIRIYDAVVPVSEIKQNYFIGLNKLFKNNCIGLNEFNNRLVELKFNLFLGNLHYFKILI
jgi:prepilin-type N-terminal cleavage/methylation domain-containing protein